MHRYFGDFLVCFCPTSRPIELLDFFLAGRIPFAFLEDIHQRFVRTYGRAVLSAQAYAMNDEFSRVLSQQMEYYSNDPDADRINRIKGEMSQVILWNHSFNHKLKMLPNLVEGPL